MSGMAGTGGAPVTNGHRYARFVALSEQGGGVWSAVAELEFFTTGDVALARSGWVVTADSEELDDESAPATAAIDGDTATFWHTAWEPGGDGDAVLPHELRVDFGAARVITAFSYLPRQDRANGRILAWELYLSNDGATWGAAVEAGTFPAGTSAQKISL